MKKIVCFFSLVMLIASCYPSYSIQSAKVLEKGELSGHVSAFVPLVNPGIGLRYGLDGTTELSIKSSIISNELGFKRSFISNENDPFQLALGLTLGNGSVAIPTGEYAYDVGLWGDSILAPVRVQEVVPLVSIPMYFSLHIAEDNINIYGRLAPSWTEYKQKPSLGLMSNLGIAFGRKTTFCVEAFLHTPINKHYDPYTELFGYEEVESSTLYNFGLMVGVVLGEF